MSQRISFELKGHFAGELDLHFDGLDGKCEGVKLEFLFRHIKRQEIKNNFNQ